MLTTLVTTYRVRYHVQGLGKIMGTVVKDIHSFMNMALDHHLPVMLRVSFLE